jgi:hypothetical protein
MNELEYWKENYEKAMAELEKAQSLLFEMSQRLRELEAKLLGGTTQ